MIVPSRITKFDRSQAELQEFLLFCVLVHGKKAEMQAVKLHHFLEWLAAYTGETLPFKMVDIAMNYELDGEFDDAEDCEDLLTYAMKRFGLGQYGRIFQAIDDFLKLPDLRTVTIEELENCFAVGPKSARFFVVHSRPNQQHAILDVHILKWLRLQGVNAPRTTPQSKHYMKFEKIFLQFVAHSGQSIAEFDLNIWKKLSNERK